MYGGRQLYYGLIRETLCGWLDKTKTHLIKYIWMTFAKLSTGPNSQVNRSSKKCHPQTNGMAFLDYTLYFLLLEINPSKFIWWNIVIFTVLIAGLTEL